MSSRKKYFIGIEGGGTKSTAILCNENGKIFSQTKGKATNPNVVGFEQATKVILNLISDCSKKAKCPLKEISSIAIGTAGGGNKQNQLRLKKELRKILRRNTSAKIKVTSDAEIAVEAALGNESGIVLIAGTGSILFGKNYDSQNPNPTSQIFRIGGWGKIIGDEGSGFAIARDALKEVVKSFDRKIKPTELTNAALSFFNVKSVVELPSKISNTNTVLASFAPIVIQLAKEKDFQSLFVVEFHCNELLQQLHLMFNNFHNAEKLPLVLLGGLLENENFYSQMLKEKIKHYFPQLEIRKPKFPATHGAILISMKK
ncbi:MAG: hypothetical protein FJ218_04665 [Ignavibacteria bacterium]|nr:hypothetical protein [Ignavibacteria bacterium]